MPYTITVITNDGLDHTYGNYNKVNAGKVARKLVKEYGGTAKRVSVQDTEMNEVLRYVRSVNGDGTTWYKSAL